MDKTITVELTLARLLSMPGDAVIKLLQSSNASKELIDAAYDAECVGQARWPVMNALRNWKF